jgi:N-acyl-D-amino-acid deacylase
VLDPREYIDQATFEKPHQYATGVRCVLLAGKAAIDNARPTGHLLGRAIRHGGI